MLRFGGTVSVYTGLVAVHHTSKSDNNLRKMPLLCQHVFTSVYTTKPSLPLSAFEAAADHARHTKCTDWKMEVVS